MSVREGPGLNRELQSGPPFHYIDYEPVTTGAASVGYVVGTNARRAEPGRYPPFFVAKIILAFCTQDCWLRFNNARAVPVFLPSRTWVAYEILTSIIYHQQATVAGALQLTFQG